jgi:hypothetical protein
VGSVKSTHISVDDVVNEAYRLQRTYIAAIEEAAKKLKEVRQAKGEQDEKSAIEPD